MTTYSKGRENFAFRELMVSFSDSLRLGIQVYREKRLDQLLLLPVGRISRRIRVKKSYILRTVLTRFARRAI